MTIAATLRALADPGRRRIMVLLADRETAVGAIAKALEMSQPAVSQHLKTLRAAGLVQARPRAQARLYSLRAQAVAETADWLLRLAHAGPRPLRLAAPAAEADLPAVREPDDGGGYGAFVDAHTLRFQRRLAGTPARAWAALTEAGALASWLAPGVIDPWVGGRVGLRFPDGGATGVVTEWRPPERLAYTWREGANESAVAFALEAASGGVRLTLTHERLPLAEAADFGHGWHASLDALDALLAGADGEAIRAAWQGKAVDNSRYRAEHAAVANAEKGARGGPVGASDH
ncbi:MAG TPA: metalloregulator ArsR/SmtB family transcription factor [Caulobacteraceae bacterium]|nr:metalloregulator ArsR/SmtB family transcription factor [Caulobacteraceae bacterium]